MANVVCENIKRMREEKKLSINKLAKKAGIAYSTLHAIENKTNSPSVETVILLAAALDTTVSELMNEESALSTEAEKARNEITNLYDLLPEDAKEQALDFLRFLHHSAKSARKEK